MCYGNGCLSDVLASYHDKVVPKFNFDLQLIIVFELLDL